MSQRERVPGDGDQKSLSHVQVENANSIIPEHFRDSEGLRVMEEIKAWLVSVVSQRYVTSQDVLRLPREFRDHAEMFSGRGGNSSINFTTMIREGGVDKLQCVIGEPDPAKLVAPEDKGRCAILAVGFLHGQELKFVRMFKIRNDGKVVAIKDEMPDAQRLTEKPRWDVNDF